MEAPEFGPVADVNAMYDAVQNMRPTPLRKTPVIALVLAGLVPLLAMASIEIPIKQLLGKLLGALL